MCGQSAVSDVTVERYFAPEKEASLLLCEEQTSQRAMALFELAGKGLFFVIK